MPRLGISGEFLADYARLERHVRRAVDEAIGKFAEHTFAGMHLEKPIHARDPNVRTIRITKFYRGVVLAPEQGDEYCLLTVRPHDEAIAYACSRRFAVNARLGVFEVHDDDAVRAVEPRLEVAARASRKSGLLAGVSDGDLVKLGISPERLPLVRLLHEDEHLEALRGLLPEHQYDALVALAAGMSPEEAWEQIAAAHLVDRRAPAVVDTSDLGAAMERTPGRIALVSGPEELRDILAMPFDAWRVFLHPSQRRVAHRPSWSGPAQITGGPGTGKTVVALHRVKFLAHRLGPGQRILLTTYTLALAATLELNLAKILSPDLLARVDVLTVDAFAARVLAAGDAPVPRLLGDREEQEMWRRVVVDNELPWDERFLTQEYRHVVLARQVGTLEQYLRVARTGRGSALVPVQRARLWRAVQAYEQLLADAGVMTYRQACARAAAELAGRARPPYRHVVVDEAQDLHPPAWRMLRAAVAEGPDDLFVAGDPHQRIYDTKVSLSQVGIKVAGRSTRLRVNYRTTDEILTWATGIMTGVRVEALADDGTPDTLADCRSPLHGPAPTLRRAPDRDKEIHALVDQVRAWIDAGVRTADIAVAARTWHLAGLAAEGLRAAGVEAVLSRGTPPAPADPGVRTGTMHGLKGLEFRCVAVIGVDADLLPRASALSDPNLDQLQYEADLLAERCLLFVACTRPRDALYVSWTGRPSPFLPL